MSSLAALHRLTLTNFKRHSSLEIVFSEGLTTIKGPNYSGKSSLMQGILYALGGATLVPGKRKVIVRKGAKDCEVNLLFSTDDNSYFNVWRSFNDARLEQVFLEELPKPEFFNEAPMIEKRKEIATGHTAVNDKIEQLLGMPIDIWVMLHVSRQTETAALLTLGVSKLNAMIEKIAKADFIDRVTSVAATRENTEVSTLKALPPAVDLNELAADIDKQKTVVENKKQEQEFLDKELENAKAGLDSLSTAIKKASETNETITATERARDIAATKLESAITNRNYLLDKIAPLKEKIAQFEQISQLKIDAKTLRDKIAHAMIVNQTINTAKALIEKRTKWLEGEGRQQLEQYNKGAAALAEAEQIVETAKKSFDEANELNKKAVAELEAAEKESKDSVCSKCLRPFDKKHAERASIVLEKAKQAHKESSLVLQNVTHALAVAKSKRTEILHSMPLKEITATYVLREQEVAAAKNSLAEKVSVAQAEIDEMEMSAVRLDDLIATLANDKRHYGTLELELEGAIELISKWENEVAKNAAILESLERVDISELNAKRDAIEAERDRIAAERMQIAGDLRAAAAILTASEARLKEAQVIEERRATVERKASLYGGLKKYLRDNKSAFMADIWDSLMRLTSEFVSTVTAGDVGNIDRSHDGEFSYMEDGEVMPMIAGSGGQAAIASIGLRLALPSLLHVGSRLILLDEPSSELSDNLAASLAGALKSQDKQIILITHREGEEFVSDKTIILER